MHFISETTSDGVCEQLFTLGDIPGVLWTAADATGPRPLVLVGHGGGQHKRAPGVLARARQYTLASGFAVAAIDAPGHGDRPKTSQDEQFAVDMRKMMASGEDVWPMVSQYNAELAQRAVPEWQATLDALQETDRVAAGGPTGFWGISVGSGIGIPFVAAEPRVSAAVFGLVGYEHVGAAAAQITIPVEFVLQWDDELVPRDSGLALFDALASAEKTLHANPGRHMAVPRFETDSAQRFFERHLRLREPAAG
jgi:pimeloyl-ACP methyl ester carboxylesterase